MAKLSDEEKERRAVSRRRKAALIAEADALRNEAKRRVWAENGTRLTRAELLAGVPCRGCGLPIIDRLGDRPALMRMTEDERSEYEASEAEFAARHPDCRAARWSMSRSRTMHCCFCCPPPPLSEEQIERISTIFKYSSVDPVELDTWRLSLTCEHVVDKTQHKTNRYWSRSTVFCAQCQQLRGIVTSEKLPPGPVRRTIESNRLEAEIQTAREEQEKHQKKADSARRRLTELENELDTLDPSQTGK